MSRSPEDVRRCDDCGAVAPPYTPVRLTLTTETPTTTRRVVGIEYCCAACLARLDDDQGREG